jgi:hypothetical protein
MSRAHPDELPPSIYVVAVVAISLILYILLSLFPVNFDFNYEPVQVAVINSDGLNRYTKRVSAAALPSKYLERDAQSGEPIDELVYQPDTANTEGALQDSETATERSTRLIREALGIKERHASEVAVIVELKLTEGCLTEEGEQTSLPILYRFESPTIRTSSFNELRSLVSQFRRCEKNEFYMTQNTQSGVESNVELAQMRFNELKYFFTQNSVPKSALHYSKYP